MDQLWKPDRLRSVASVLTRYGAVLANGDRIQTGIEGDVAYRGGDVGTVTQLHRTDDGRVTFVAQFDEGGSRELTNYGILPEQTWEVLPSYLPVLASRLQAEQGTFRGEYADSSIGGDAVDGVDGASAASGPPSGFSIDAEGHVVHNAGGVVQRVVAGYKGAAGGATLYMEDGACANPRAARLRARGGKPDAVPWRRLARVRPPRRGGADFGGTGLPTLKTSSRPCTSCSAASMPSRRRAQSSGRPLR